MLRDYYDKSNMKKIIDQIKYKGTILTGEVTKDNGDGTYDVKINQAAKAYPNVETAFYGETFSVNEIVIVTFEDGNKERPRIWGHGKKVPQDPKKVEVDYSGGEAGGVQTEVVTIYSSANDGSIWNGNANYDACHAATSGYEIQGISDYLSIGYCYDNIVFPELGLVHVIVRSFLFFDTSAIPTGANITSAILYIYKDVDDSVIETEFDLVVQDGQPNYPHSILVLGDYNRENYHNNGGSINTVNISDSVYSPIPLNDNGKNWINKGGLTKFCLRSSREIAKLSSGSSPYYEFVAIWASEKGEDYKPKLIITYEI